MKLRALAVLVFLASWRLAGAASWYVDKDASGSANGTSWANAWTSLSSVVWGGSGVKAGDTLYISGGTTSKDYGTQKLTVGASGSSGSPITIKPGQDAGHNGVVIWDFDSLGDTTAGANDYAMRIPRSWLVISGNYGGACHFLIKNLRNINTNTTGYAIQTQNSSNTGNIIEYIRFENCGNPIDIRGWVTGEIRYCQFYEFRGDAAISANSSNSSGAYDQMLIHDNDFVGLYNSNKPAGALYAYGGPDSIQGTNGIYSYRNTFDFHNVTVSDPTRYTSSQHPDHHQIQGKFFHARGNRFKAVGDSCYDFDRFDNTYGGALTDVKIENDDVVLTQDLDLYPEYFRAYSSDATAITDFSRITIQHFTIDTNGKNFPVFRIRDYVGGGGTANPTASDVHITHGIFYNCGSGSTGPLIEIAASTGFTASDWDLDYNIAYRPSGTMYMTVDGTSATFLSWESTYTHNKIAQPSMLDISVDGHLASGDTVAKNYATTSTLAVDFDGNSRPQGVANDTGAYEITAGDTTPPTLVSAVINSAGTTLTLTFSESVSIGAGGNGGWSVSLSGGVSALTYSSGSGSSALVYNLSRTVDYGETGTASYIQPGNGVEDAAGNDLVSLGSATVDNTGNTHNQPATAVKVRARSGVGLRL